jgi:hypothetical protein
VSFKAKRPLVVSTILRGFAVTDWKEIHAKIDDLARQIQERFPALEMVDNRNNQRRNPSRWGFIYYKARVLRSKVTVDRCTKWLTSKMTPDCPLRFALSPETARTEIDPILPIAYEKFKLLQAEFNGLGADVSFSCDGDAASDGYLAASFELAGFEFDFELKT